MYKMYMDAYMQCCALQSQKTTWGVESFLHHVDLRD